MTLQDRPDPRSPSLIETNRHQFNSYNSAVRRRNRLAAGEGRAANPVGTEGRQTEQNGRDARTESNVVPFPRDWLGPREELVPFGANANPSADLPESKEVLGSKEVAGSKDVAGS